MFHSHFGTLLIILVSENKRKFISEGSQYRGFSLVCIFFFFVLFFFIIIIHSHK